MQKTPDFNPEFQAHLPRQGHSLSHVFDFTCTTGHLNPIFHTILSPGDTVNLGFDFKLRTMPLEVASFCKLTAHTEYFFVPMQLLYQAFDSVYYQITDQFSSLFQGNVVQDFPLQNIELTISDLFNDRANAALYYGESSLPVESVGQSAARFLDLMGFCPIGVCCNDSSGGWFYNPNVFPYQVAAYNCIYQYFYRLDAREKFDMNTFNLDRFYSSITASIKLPKESFLMKYRPLGNDYFTDVKVSPIVDSLNLNQNLSSLPLADSWLSRSGITGAGRVLGSGDVGSPTYPLSSAPNATSHSNPQNYIQTQFGFTSLQHSSNPTYNGSEINTANIRALFANEKLWSITGRAKKDYDSQTLAHFGFEVPHDVKHQITCIGHDISSIPVGEVISTASTSTAPLGEIAGKGYSSQTVTPHKFTAPCHGVVMAIFSVVVDRNYQAGVLKANAVTNRNDLFVPEFDHLGEVPLFAYETQYFDSPDTSVSNVVGWQYRYEHWKRRFNRTSGAFSNVAGGLKSWAPTFDPYGGNYLYIGQSGKRNNFPNTPSFNSFLNLPTDVNQLFLAQYPSVWSSAYEDESSWAAIYDNDPFVVNGFVNCTLVSSMSDYSLPRLDA